MDDRSTRLDDTLAALEAALRDGAASHTRDLYLTFDGELTRYVQGEERLLFPVLERFATLPTRATETMRREHRSLRRLVDTLGESITRADVTRGLGVLGQLRSVLLLHLEKERWVLAPLDPAHQPA